MKYASLKRRHFLQGTGAYLLLPLLPSLMPRKALAQAVDQQRFVFCGSMFGRKLDHWYPSEENFSVASSGVRYQALADFAPISPILDEKWNALRNKISLLRGLDGMDDVHDGHAPGMALCGMSYSQIRKRNFGYSLDCLLAESSKFYPQTPMVDAIRICPEGDGSSSLASSFTSKSGVVEYLRSIRQVEDLYYQFFSPHLLGVKSEREKRHKIVTNMVFEDYKNLLNNRRIAQSDRLLVENQMSLISDAEKRLGLTNPKCQNVAEQPPTFTNAFTMHETAMDLQIAALSCGMTKIAMHWIEHYSSEMKINVGEAHSAAHGGISKEAESGRTPVEQYKINNGTLSIARRYLEKLDATADTNGRSLLQNTLFLYSCYDSTGRHEYYDMPVLVAGNPDKLNLGYYVDYRPYPLKKKSGSVYYGRPINNLIVTLLKSFGLSEKDYQKNNQSGVGLYDVFATLDLKDHYAPFIKASMQDKVLPFVSKVS